MDNNEYLGELNLLEGKGFVYRYKSVGEDFKLVLHSKQSHDSIQALNKTLGESLRESRLSKLEQFHIKNDKYLTSLYIAGFTLSLLINATKDKYPVYNERLRKLFPEYNSLVDWVTPDISTEDEDKPIIDLMKV